MLANSILEGDLRFRNERSDYSRIFSTILFLSHKIYESFEKLLNRRGILMIHLKQLFENQMIVAFPKKYNFLRGTLSKKVTSYGGLVEEIQ